ncbi:HAD-IA family hydrolase [Rhabdaerophilum calidifontis]|uniref:HAD-IA family hydrolase n=1 Tax=Rhabdaerophilum calidifontis TaxID=2604328 RepID=UPI0012389479|nr:HAD-IA family hydrolase [Rhabdaerophilum calidifontis]
MLSTLVFDVGNVLIHWDPDLLYRRLIPDPAARAAFFRDILPPDWNREQDRGRPWAEAEAERIALFPEKAELIRAFRAEWHDMVPHALDRNVRLLETAREKGIPCYAITNFAADTFAETQERFPFLTAFDGIVVSAAEQLLKPDPAIFTLFLDRYGRRAEECLFMDDSAANVAAAAALGFATILVMPETDLAAEVRAYGFRV